MMRKIIFSPRLSTFDSLAMCSTTAFYVTGHWAIGLAVSLIGVAIQHFCGPPR